MRTLIVFFALLPALAFAYTEPREAAMARARAFGVVAATHAAMRGGQPKPNPDNPAPQPAAKCPATCKCEGTGKVRSGDGLIEIPCPCKKAGKCSCRKGDLADAEEKAIDPIVAAEPKEATCGNGIPFPLVFGGIPGFSRDLLGGARICTENGCPDPGVVAGAAENTDPASPEPAPENELVVATMAQCLACPQTVSAAETLQRNGWAKTGVRVVSREKDPELIAQWEVTSYPTVLLLKRGRIVARLTGAPAIGLTAEALGQFASQQVVAASTPPAVVAPKTVVPTATSSVTYQPYRTSWSYQYQYPVTQQWVRVRSGRRRGR